MPAVEVKRDLHSSEDFLTERSAGDRGAQQGRLQGLLALSLVLFLLLRDSHSTPVGFLYYWQGSILGFSLSKFIDAS